MCWSLGVLPSDLSRVFWSRTLSDLRAALKLKVGFEQAKVIQEWQTFSLLLSYALGGKKPEGKPPSNFEVAEQQLKAVFGGR